MSTLVIALMIAAMVVTVAVLITGVVAMARGGSFNQRWSNRLMRYRIMAQGVALVLFLLALWLLRNGG